MERAGRARGCGGKEREMRGRSRRMGEVGQRLAGRIC